MDEPTIGTGLGGALGYLKYRGDLNKISWCGRKTDMKKSQLETAAINEKDGPIRVTECEKEFVFKEIKFERTDEYGRILTPKEAFRRFSHQFHGKRPGFKKRQKRMREHQREMKASTMKLKDTPSQSVERMYISQQKQQTPHLLLSGSFVI